MSEEHPDPKKLWRWRRWFAIAAMSALIVSVPIIAVTMSPESLEAARYIVNTWQFCLTLVVIAYVANCAVEAFIDRNKP